MLWALDRSCNMSGIHSEELIFLSGSLLTSRKSGFNVSPGRGSVRMSDWSQIKHCIKSNWLDEEPGPVWAKITG